MNANEIKMSVQKQYTWLTEGMLSLPIEIMIWLIAFAGLAWLDPMANQASLCLSQAAGFGNCWGCGLGKSIAFLLDGSFVESWQAHKLGIPTTLLLTHRIGQLAWIEFQKIR